MEITTAMTRMQTPPQLLAVSTAHQTRECSHDLTWCSSIIACPRANLWVHFSVQALPWPSLSVRTHTTSSWYNILVHFSICPTIHVESHVLLTYSVARQHNCIGEGVRSTPQLARNRNIDQGRVPAVDAPAIFSLFLR